MSAGNGSVVVVCSPAVVSVEVVEVESPEVPVAVVVVVTIGSPTLEHTNRNRRRTVTLNRIARKIPEPRIYALRCTLGRFAGDSLRPTQGGRPLVV